MTMLPPSPTSAPTERIGQFVDQYAATPFDSTYETRRAAPRYTMGETVDILLDSYETPAEVVLATGRDISLGGLGVYANKPIRPGTDMVVRITNGAETLLSKAVAVHSTQSVGLFKIGARFVI